MSSGNSTAIENEHLPNFVAATMMFFFVLICVYLTAARTYILDYRRKLKEGLVDHRHVMDDLVDAEEAMESNPLLRAGGYLAFHTQIGKGTLLAVRKMNDFITQALSYLTSITVANVAQYFIERLDNPSEGQLQFLGFVFTISFLWIILTNIEGAIISRNVGPTMDITKSVHYQGGRKEL